MAINSFSRTSAPVTQFRQVVSKDQSRVALRSSLAHVANLDRTRLANLLKFISIATRESNKNNRASCEVNIGNISHYLEELSFPSTASIILARHIINMAALSGVKTAHIKEYFLGHHTMSPHVKDFIRYDLGIRLEDMALKSRDIDRGLSLVNPLLLGAIPGKEPFLELWTRFSTQFTNQRELGASRGSVLASCYLPAVRGSTSLRHAENQSGIYYGYLTNGRPDKYGHVIYANDDSYCGAISLGSFDGYGTFISPSKHESYYGFWKDGQKEVYGSYTYANKDIYAGNWKRDKKNGYGTYSYANGDRFVGSWQDDKRSGNGVFSFANGERIIGIWQNDVLCSTD